ncbi:hypothetical protein CsSME_00050399 [Camellia sinensis var. sinensis]
MDNVYCLDCKRATKVVFDHSAEDTVCSECGLMLESHSIDETSEWRTFANESGSNDPVRVGGPTNLLLTDGGLSTVFLKPNGVTSDFLSNFLGCWQIAALTPIDPSSWPSRPSSPCPIVEMGTIRAGDFMRLFCSNLGMNNQAVKVAQEVVQKSKEFDIRRSPISIATAIIYIVTQLSDK